MENYVYQFKSVIKFLLNLLTNKIDPWDQMGTIVIACNNLRSNTPILHIEGRNVLVRQLAEIMGCFVSEQRYIMKYKQK